MQTCKANIMDDMSKRKHAPTFRPSATFDAQNIRRFINSLRSDSMKLLPEYFCASQRNLRVIIASIHN